MAVYTFKSKPEKPEIIIKIPEKVIGKLKMVMWCIQKLIETDDDFSVDIAKPEDIDHLISDLLEIKQLWIKS